MYLKIKDKKTRKILFEAITQSNQKIIYYIKLYNLAIKHVFFKVEITVTDGI